MRWLGLLCAPLVATLDLSTTPSIVNDPILPPSAAPKRLVLVDGFTEYIGGVCRAYCQERDIEVIDVVSPYLAQLLKSQGQEVPPHLLAPTQETLGEWLEGHGVEADELPLSAQATCFVSESDCGVAVAEEIAKLVGVETGNPPMQELQSKFVNQERLRRCGLPALRQCLASNWDEARAFLNGLWLDASVPLCVVKPERGVASEGVRLCRGFGGREGARAAFDALLLSPQYGGGLRRSVLLQEYVEGEEYAVDTVTIGGETKLMGVWRYAKLPRGPDAPFVYLSSSLVALEETPRAFREGLERFVRAALNATGVTNSACHVEVKHRRGGADRGRDRGGERGEEAGEREEEEGCFFLMEINPRFHAQRTVDILRESVGYDPMAVRVGGHFHPPSFSSLPPSPLPLKKRGRIVHLSLEKGGVVRAVRHVDFLRSLPAVREVLLNFGEGERVQRTRDLLTEGGYVVLLHESEEVVQGDYDQVVQLQGEIYDVQTEDEGERQGEGGERREGAGGEGVGREKERERGEEGKRVGGGRKEGQEEEGEEGEYRAFIEIFEREGGLRGVPRTGRGRGWARGGWGRVLLGRGRRALWATAGLYAGSVGAALLSPLLRPLFGL